MLRIVDRTVSALALIVVAAVVLGGVAPRVSGQAASMTAVIPFACSGR
jgi:hypothetical protein